MEKFVWLFPIIFIFHDMEEIIGFGIYLSRNKILLKEKYPWAIAPYKDFSTEGFSLAVFEELALCIAVCTAALFFDINALWYIWLGGFIGCTLHFIIHIGQAVVMRKYIPAVITSIICLPISVWMIYNCAVTIDDNLIFVSAFAILGIVIVALNLKLAQKLIGWFTRKMKINPLV